MRRIPKNPTQVEKPLRVDTLPVLQLAQRHLGGPLNDDAESVLSFCVLHLRERKCVLPVELAPRFRRLMAAPLPATEEQSA